MTSATMAAKLTAAGVRYTAANYDGVVVLSVQPRLGWDEPVRFYCCAGRVRAEYRGQPLTVRGAIGTAKLSGVLA